MNVVVAIDSFKGSLSSLQAGNAIKNGITEVFPKAGITVLPVADGGEGTIDALCTDKISINVTGPLGETVTAKYGILDDTAVIEIAEAAGLALVPVAKRNPLNTTTFGVGEIIKDAISKGYRKFIIGIGGSATNDGGIGMLSALGFEFLDKYGNVLPPYGRSLEHIKSISSENIITFLNECEFKIACDVENPLCGKNGCSQIYGPQKGAEPHMITLMDKWLSDYANIAESILPDSDRNFPGSGAAGGLGFAFKSFLDATLKPGVSLITEKIQLEKYVKNADFVITGEGRLDKQSVMGKTPIGVAEIAKKYNVPVVAFSGCIGEGAEKCNEFGIDAFFPIIRKITSLEDALDLKAAEDNLKNTVIQTFRLIKTIKNV